ncbi:unnamed protein product [Phytomonas sp. Hart1]|nr:unnamed protein product [Phytomonas sp. Hart1]|eukprot:CCW67792.1 unnamed protein product [Phytomonas sp. isolate Hart1]
MIRRIAFKVAATAKPGRVFTPVLPLIYRGVSSTPALNLDNVIVKIQSEGIFDTPLIKDTLTQFLDNLSSTAYLKCVTPDELSNHVLGVLNAKGSEKMCNPFEFSREESHSAFYICKNDPESIIRSVRKMAKYTSRSDIPTGHSTIVRSFNAKDASMVIYTVSFVPFGVPQPDERETQIEKLIPKDILDHLSEEKRRRVQKLLLQRPDSVVPVLDISVHGTRKDTILFTMISCADKTDYIVPLLNVFQEIKGSDVVRVGSCSLVNGDRVYTMVIKGATVDQVRDQASMVGLLSSNASKPTVRMYESGLLTCEQAVYIDAVFIFSFYFTQIPPDDSYRRLRTVLENIPHGVNWLNTMRNSLTQETMSESYMGKLVENYPQFVKLIYEDFRLGSTEERRASISKEIVEKLIDDGRLPHDIAIFMSFLKFNEVVLKHNFFKPEKAALAFRLDPSFLKDLEYPLLPYGVFLFAGGQWRGFHIRFTDIARGGVRMIISKPNTYTKNKRTVFQENYNLALTQLNKNKDIPEGGSKGTILVSSRFHTKFDERVCKRIFLQYVDAMLDLVMPGESGVVDRLKKEEIIFLGPDEYTAGSFPSAGALHSKRRGYANWKSLTTGKDPDIGGIPHDVYAMTTHSVRTYVKCIYKELGLNGASMRKFQTGGPDGDLGSNEILLSNEKLIGIADGTGSLHDPEGICREELIRLACSRLPLAKFNRGKLSKDGFLVLVDDVDVKLPDGTLVRNGVQFRDEFHFLKYSDADIFLPCGGRPRSITIENVARLLKVKDVDGEDMLRGRVNPSPDELKFKIIVDGANLFISQDARLALERCGVVLIKDASTNKGGVTSSSLEVLAGLSLSDEEHSKHMCMKDESNPPVFYKRYVEEVIARVDENAEKEFNAIWSEWKKDTSKSRILISDALSSKNVKIRANMLKSDIFEDKKLVRYLMMEYAPKTLLQLVPIDKMLQRVPEGYQHAICAVWLASNYVYKNGQDGNEFDFFKFLTEEIKRLNKKYD